jgi:hypothetical protein
LNRELPPFLCAKAARCSNQNEIIDPKQINDRLSEALASVANEVHKLRERVQQL